MDGSAGKKRVERKIQDPHLGKEIDCRRASLATRTVVLIQARDASDRRGK